MSEEIVMEQEQTVSPAREDVDDLIFHDVEYCVSQR